MSQPDRFLDHPEIKLLSGALFTDLIAESDRGAVLVGVAHVDNHLAKLLEAVFPASVSNKQRKEAFGRGGPFGTVSAKAETARLMRLIPEYLFDCITQLRKLRNDVAHSPTGFELKAHEKRLRKMFELGDGIPTAVNRFGVEVMMRLFTEQVTGPDGPKDDDGQLYFKSAEEVYDYMAGRPDLIEPLDQKQHRYELAVGLMLMCALIVRFREEAKAHLGNDDTIAAVARRFEQRDVRQLTSPPEIESPDGIT